MHRQPVIVVVGVGDGAVSGWLVVVVLVGLVLNPSGESVRPVVGEHVGPAGRSHPLGAQPPPPPQETPGAGGYGVVAAWSAQAVVHLHAVGSHRRSRRRDGPGGCGGRALYGTDLSGELGVNGGEGGSGDGGRRTRRSGGRIYRRGRNSRERGRRRDDEVGDDGGGVGDLGVVLLQRSWWSKR